MGLSFFRSLRCIFIRHLTLRWSREVGASFVAFAIGCTRGNRRKRDLCEEVLLLMTQNFTVLISRWQYARVCAMAGAQTFQPSHHRPLHWWPEFLRCTQGKLLRSMLGVLWWFLQSVLPCIVQILPQNSPLVHCIRAYERVRILTGMTCMTSSRMERLGTFIQNYEYWCSVRIFFIFEVLSLNFGPACSWQIRQRLRLFQAACNKPYSWRYSLQGNHKSWFHTPWWRFSAGGCRGIQADKFQERCPSGEFERLLLPSRFRYCFRWMK